MKRILCMILIGTLFCGSAFAGAVDFSNCTDDYLIGLINDCQALMAAANEQLNKRQIENGNILNKSDNYLFLYQKDGLTAYLSGYDFDSIFGILNIQVIVINNTDGKVTFRPSSASINGWGCDIGGTFSIEAGQKKKQNITIYNISDIDKISDIESVQLFYDISNKFGVYITEDNVIFALGQ